MDRHSSHSQKVPYARKERRKSLLSKVKDSVKDMLSPSWLTDLVSNVKNDSITENPGDSSGGTLPNQMSTSPAPGPSVTQAGFQQPFLPFQAQGTVLGNGQPHTMEFSRPVNPGETMSPFQTSNLPPPISEFTSSQLPLARLTEKSDSVLANEDTLSQRSDASKSTSGCSSMVPQTDPQTRDGGGTAREKRKADDEDGNEKSSPLSSFDQPSTKRQRLQVSINSSKTWSQRLSDSLVSKQQASSVNRPAFNVTLFGSPLNDSSILGSSFHESSFYPGKTAFGGRSSMSFRSQRQKTDLNQSLPSRLSVPVKAFMKAKPRVNPAKEAVTSSTAKRILNALDRMPTPVNDAKRIPLIVPPQWTENPSFFSRDNSAVRSGPPTQKLNINSLASISKNRQQSTSTGDKTLDKTNTEVRNSSMLLPSPMPKPSRENTVILDTNREPQPGPSGKIRREKSYHRGSASAKVASLQEEDTEILQPPDLRSDFTLPVSSMPQFNFQPSQSGFTKPPLNFTFSSPIQENAPKASQPSPAVVGGFQFSSPISVDKSSETAGPTPSTTQKSTLSNTYSFTSPASSSGPASFSVSSFGSFNTAPKPKPRVNGPSETDASSVGGGLKVASELKTGSVMDILGGGSKAISSTKDESPSGGPQSSSLSSMFKPSGWKCDVCLLNNQDTAKSCVACQSPKPLGSNPQKTAAPTPAAEPFKSTMFSKPASGSWTCDTCLIPNKEDVNNCVACKTPKPATSLAAKPTAEPFKLNKSDGSWTCDTCLIKNKPDIVKCVACQTSKPGKPAAEPFKFSKPAGTWTCDACLVQNKTDLTKCVACQTPKPGGTTSSHTSLVATHGSLMPGNWICKTCLIQNKEDSSVCAACKASKPSSSDSKPDSKLGGTSDVFAKFKPATGQWECEVCLVQNKTEVTKCVACQTPKPLKAFKHPPGDWVCDTCLVSNKETATNCVACNYARQGPPRTQTVPSCAKSYSVSQAGGFNLSKETNKNEPPSAITVNETGGFKFNTESKGATTETSGFKFGSAIVNPGEPTGTGFKFSPASSAEDSKASTGGFTFGTVSSSAEKSSATKGSGFTFGSSGTEKSESSGSMFKFGASSSEEKSSAPVDTGFKLGSTGKSVDNSVASGFKFGSSSSGISESQSASSAPNSDSDKTEKPAGGFQFGTGSLSGADKGLGSAFKFGSSDNNDTVAKPVVGFQFGKTDLSSAPSVTSNSATVFTSISTSSSNTPQPGGFTFGQTSTETSKETVSVTGGFNLKAGDTTNSKSSSETKSIGGFNFSADNKGNTSVPQTVNQNSIGGFTFGAAKTQANGETQGSAKPPETSSSFGGFVFGQSKPVVTSTPTPAVGGFTFSGQSSQTIPSATKRGRDDESGETKEKKPMITFGQSSTGASSTTPFQFGATNNSTTSGSVTSSAVFGQANSSTPSFNFTAGANQTEPKTAFSSTPVFQFGGASTTASTTNSSTPGGLFTFSANPAKPASQAFAPTPAFGSGNSAFGASSAPVFGGTSNSSTPAFGNSPSVFGGANATSSNPAPAFGVGIVNPPAPAAQTPSSGVFQFGGKPPESSAPNQSFSFTATAGPNLNFGVTTSATTNVFSATGTPGTSDRRIKKAVRKIRK